MVSFAWIAAPRPAAHRLLARIGMLALCAIPTLALAQGHASPAAAAPTPKEIGQQVRQALDAGVMRGQQIVVGAGPAGKATGHAAVVNPKASRQAIRAKAAALAGRKESIEEIIEPARERGEVHWDYAGANGPQSWANLKPEYSTCATGKRQSPIDIDGSVTLRGPAEAIVFDYPASSATVVNNGHTIQIDMHDDNGIVVRGSRYQLLQLHFHHPSEERINQRGFAMVAHLVHRDYMGRLAVVAVLLEPGEANPVINQFWTYMPLGPGDQVAMPLGSVALAQLLPKDQRYYQFMGSLTTPPCSEEVLWMILKQPVTLSQEQMRLFAQQFPNNARPVQPINGRVIRDGQ
ncbi:MAG: carbonic anhydrase family protein [Burkholderiaceae bacterium]